MRRKVCLLVSLLVVVLSVSVTGEITCNLSFDEAEGQYVYDLSGYNHDAVIMGAERIPDGVNARVVFVVPVYRDFYDGIPPAPRRVEDFDVEAPTIHRLERKQVLGYFRPEHLEATLRILQAGHGKQPHYRVENAAHQVPVPGFPIAHCAGCFP